MCKKPINNPKHHPHTKGAFCRRVRQIFISCFLVLGLRQNAHAILAGGEFDLPSDSPSGRIDSLSENSPYNFVGALEISTGSGSYFGSASALSSHWVLTAWHNVDFNDDGNVDAGLSVNFHLPGFGTYAASSYSIHPSFTGFGNPSIHYDLSLLYFSDPLPDLLFPTLGNSLSIGDTATMIGYGRSGYGSCGYTTGASLTDRRIGYNEIDEFETSGDGTLYRYDFDDPNTGDGLGNAIETIIGPGDSGGSLLIGNSLVGVNTFTEGYGGRFGDIGGGIALNNEWGWIGATTGLTVPEPASVILFLLGAFTMILRRRIYRAKENH